MYADCTKKLSLDSAKKPVLVAALKATADRLGKDMRIIYDRTAEAVEASGDRVMLGQAQVNVTVSALRMYVAEHGADAAAEDMLAQLSMTRKEYAARQAAC